MSRLPIRVRLALVFALAMAIALAGAGWFAYSRVSSDLSRALDQDLRGRGQDLSALVADGGTVQSTEGSLIENGESFAEVVDAQGRVLDATRPIAHNLLTESELDSALSGPLFTNRPSVPGLDEPARLLALPATRGGEHVVLVVGATRENRAETLSSLRASFLIGGPIALVLAALGGYLLAGAALRPIESMRRRAADISATSLDERLPVPPADDEVSRLGETLNAMLARLEDGLERERRFVADASHELRTPLALLKLSSPSRRSRVARRKTCGPRSNRPRRQPTASRGSRTTSSCSRAPRRVGCVSRPNRWMSWTSSRTSQGASAPTGRSRWPPATRSSFRQTDCGSSRP